MLTDRQTDRGQNAPVGPPSHAGESHPACGLAAPSLQPHNPPAGDRSEGAACGGACGAAHPQPSPEGSFKSAVCDFEIGPMNEMLRPKISRGSFGGATEAFWAGKKAFSCPPMLSE